MASYASNSREARRRRIVDRGTDRLALITGRIQTLPGAPSPPHPSHSPDASSSTTLIFDEPIPHHSQQISASSDGDGKVPNSLQEEEDFNPEADQVDKAHVSSNVESLFLELKPIIQENVILESTARPQSSSVPSRPIARTVHTSQPVTRSFKLPFTPKQLSSSVTESEYLRNFCSFVLAFLVVLSYAGFPILRCTLIKHVIFVRPILLLLLTNITIMVAPLLGERGADRNMRELDEASGDQGPGMAEQLGNALEVGLLLQKVIGALFMDCSIYSVIVVTSLSFFQ